jgi:hypothetical protein
VNQQIAKNIVVFLNRVQLTGSEAPALCEAMAALNELMCPPAPPVNTEAKYNE